MCGRWGGWRFGALDCNAFAAQHCNAFAAQHCSSPCSQSEGREGWGDSTVAHFACKVRGTKVAAIALPL